MTIATVHRRVRLAAIAAIVLAAPLATAPAVHAKPIKEILAAHYGWEVNKNGTNSCVRAEEQEGKCQPGRESTRIGGFQYPHGAAVNNDASSPQHGDVYVIDNTHRVQVYTPSGQFVLAFGASVNKTTGASLCTAAEMAGGDECQPGAPGAAPGHFNETVSIAIDPASGDVYVAEAVERKASEIGFRIQELSSEGAFIAELGQEVNQTTKRNICTAAEEAKGAVCAGPTEHPYEEADQPTTAHDGFALNTEQGDTVLAIGGPEGLLYVGEHGRVQELQMSGAYETEIPLASGPAGAGVSHITVDATGGLYLTYQQVTYQEGSTVYALDSSGSLTGELAPTVRQEGDKVKVEALQVDPSGRLAVTEGEFANGPRGVELRGVLYAVGEAGLGLVSEFAEPHASDYQGGFSEGLISPSFSEGGDMYGVDVSGADNLGHELLAYAAVAIGELLTGGTGACAASTAGQAEVTLACPLAGQVNPYGVPDTAVWFQWGYASTFGQQTSTQLLCSATCGETPVAVSSGAIGGLIPNATLHFRLAGEDEVIQQPEVLTGQTVAIKLPTVAPRVVGAPTASFVTSDSAVFEGEVDPENASTEYFMEYAAGEALAGCPGGIRAQSCPGVSATPPLESNVYKVIKGTFEAGALKPSTTYHFRLNAINAAGEAAVTESGGTSLPEGYFTTAPPVVPQAVTGPSSAVTTTSATISGNVNPDGAPASYAFELGVYNAAGTQYGVVQSGFAGAGTTPVGEELQLSGLQPGTTYVYRIKLESAYGTSYGAPATFTTQGLPAVLPIPTALPQLAIPKIAFPQEPRQPVHSCKKGHARDRHGRCVKRRSKRHRKGRRSRKSKRRGHRARKSNRRPRSGGRH